MGRRRGGRFIPGPVRRPGRRMPTWKAGTRVPAGVGKMALFGVLAAVILAGAAVAYGWMNRPQYAWASDYPPRVCDFNHDGVEDFVGFATYGGQAPEELLFDGKSLEPRCNGRFAGCFESCRDVSAQKRTYRVNGPTLTITDENGEEVGRIGR